MSLPSGAVNGELDLPIERTVGAHLTAAFLGKSGALMVMALRKRGDGTVVADAANTQLTRRYWANFQFRWAYTHGFRFVALPASTKARFGDFIIDVSLGLQLYQSE